MTREEVEQRFNENQALVRFAIRKYYKRYLYDDDIYQIGSIGLLNAIESHNPERGKFSGYAVTCIKHEIDKHFKALNTQMRKATVRSLDEIVAEGETIGHDEFLYDIVKGKPDVDFFDADGILEKLDEKNRFILARLANGYNQSEIARELGCTMSAVSLRVKEIRRIVKKYV